MQPHVEFVIMDAVLPIMAIENVAYAFVLFETTFSETVVCPIIYDVRCPLHYPTKN